MRYPDIDIYDQEIVDYYHRAWSEMLSGQSISGKSVYEALIRIYSNGNLKPYSIMDQFYASRSNESFPVAYIEWILFQKSGKKKRPRNVLNLLDQYFDRVDKSTERDTIMLAINYLYASALADHVNDYRRKMEYYKAYYSIKNHFPLTHNYPHLEMLAEFAPVDTKIDLCRLHGEDFFLGVKALEKYQGFGYARNMILSRIYDHLESGEVEPLIGIVCMIENVLGLRYSAFKKTVDWIIPDFECMGLYALKIGGNTMSLHTRNDNRGRIVSINSNAMVYFSFDVAGYSRRSLPIAHSRCSIILERANV